jgi:hypothetical protein
MAEKPKEPSPQKQLDETLSASKPFGAPRAEAPPVELVGRIRKLEKPDKFILLVPSSTAGADHALEINASDVIEHKLVFEDSSGEKTHSVSLAPSSQVKLTVPAASFQRPAKFFDPKQFDPKQIDPKQLEPKQFDPKLTDPKQLEPKQFDPKQIDPKHLEPKQFDPKQIDPKHLEPKQFDPKQIEQKNLEP